MAMIWSEMAMRLRKSGQGTDIVHRVVEALREEVSAVADETAAAGGSRPAARSAVAIDVVTDRSNWAAFFRKNEPLLRIHQTLFDEHRRPQRLNIVIRSTQAASSGPLRLQE